MCFSLSYHKVLYVLSTEKKSDHAVNTNFPLPLPFQRSVAWEGNGQGQINSPSGPARGEGAGEEINVRMGLL